MKFFFSLKCIARQSLKLGNVPTRQLAVLSYPEVSEVGVSRLHSAYECPTFTVSADRRLRRCAVHDRDSGYFRAKTNKGVRGGTQGPDPCL